MLRAYKYCILPTDSQKDHLAQIFGCVRFVWNLGLETRITAFKSYGKSFNSFDLAKQVAELKATDAEDGGAPWLKDCPS